MFTNGSVLQVYDVSKFVDRHPGGRDQLLMGAGRDVTQVFESYHKESTEKSVPCAMPYQTEQSRTWPSRAAYHMYTG